MKISEFNAKVALLKMRGGHVLACELVLVDGLNAAQAAQETGVDEGLISRSIKRIHGAHACDMCGQLKPKGSK